LLFDSDPKNLFSCVMADSADDIPTGLVLPGLRASEPNGGVRRAVLGVLFLATLALIWPLYSSISGVRPFVLGLPFSLAWITGWLGITFVAVLVLYRSESGDGPSESRPE